MEGEEVGEALLDGEGPEGEAEGDGVDCVGFGSTGEGSGWDRYLHGACGGEREIVYEAAAQE